MEDETFTTWGGAPELKCCHDRQELEDVNVVTETVKDGSWEEGAEELPVEIAASASVTSIGGEDARIVNPRQCLDERYAIVEWQEVAPLAEL